MTMEVSGILVAAHELKAPLSLMRQLALALEIAPVDRKPHLESQLVEVSERALRQVNDLSRVARLEDGLFELEPVSVRGVCETVMREILPMFSYEHRKIKVSYTNKSRLAVANRDLLASIIYNFCINAMHYSEVDTMSELHVSDHHGKIRLSVRDFGPALPTKIWYDINQGKFNHPTSIAMRPSSSGLGLYIANQFALHMHAKLGATRHRDGTSFFIELPISKQTSLF